MKDFAGRTALVTGGSRGIGREIALELGRNGSGVAFTYVSNDAAAEEVLDELRGMDVPCGAYKADVADFEKAQETVKRVFEEHGSIDFLVNNAGITRDTLLLTMKESDWNDVIDVNLNGMFNVTRAAVVSMMKARRGRILNVTSVSGVVGQKGQVNYSAAKAGMIGFTKALAKEVARRGITVNALALGFIETEMTGKLPEPFKETMREHAIPMQRFGTVQEAACSAMFLLSEDASYITGHTLHVDGGLAI